LITDQEGYTKGLPAWGPGWDPESRIEAWLTAASASKTMSQANIPMAGMFESPQLIDHIQLADISSTIAVALYQEKGRALTSNEKKFVEELSQHYISPSGYRKYLTRKQNIKDSWKWAPELMIENCHTYHLNRSCSDCHQGYMLTQNYTCENQETMAAKYCQERTSCQCSFYHDSNYQKKAFSVGYHNLDIEVNNPYTGYLTAENHDYQIQSFECGKYTRVTLCNHNIYKYDETSTKRTWNEMQAYAKERGGRLLSL
jgi:hypothetical protein